MTIHDNHHDHIHLKCKHLEGEALLIVRLGSRHLPVHQPDSNVFVDLMTVIVLLVNMILMILTLTLFRMTMMIAMMMMMMILMMILMMLILTLFRVTMKIKLRVAAVTEAIKRA